MAIKSSFSRTSNYDINGKKMIYSCLVVQLSVFIKKYAIYKYRSKSAPTMVKKSVKSTNIITKIKFSIKLNNEKYTIPIKLIIKSVIILD